MENQEQYGKVGIENLKGIIMQIIPVVDNFIKSDRNEDGRLSTQEIITAVTQSIMPLIGISQYYQGAVEETRRGELKREEIVQLIQFGLEETTAFSGDEWDEIIRATADVIRSTNRLINAIAASRKV